MSFVAGELLQSSQIQHSVISNLVVGFLLSVNFSLLSG
jgi:hypothetical protein